MEHLIDIDELAKRTGINDEEKIKTLLIYAEAVYTENMKYNLTGHKNLSDIIENLIIKSLEPIKNLNVPRGTLFADLGTGAGIPGIPIGIKYNSCKGILFDSNQKKIRFINKTITELNLNNIHGINTRIEDSGRDLNYREKFDLIFTRAMADINTIAELGAPLLKNGGSIILYVNKNQIDINPHIMAHLVEVGLSDNIDTEVMDEGIILRKVSKTDDRYPRRMSVIKRMAMK